MTSASKECAGRDSVFGASAGDACSFRQILDSVVPTTPSPSAPPLLGKGGERSGPSPAAGDGTAENRFTSALSRSEAVGVRQPPRRLRRHPSLKRRGKKASRLLPEEGCPRSGRGGGSLPEEGCLRSRRGGGSSRRGVRAAGGGGSCRGRRARRVGGWLRKLALLRSQDPFGEVGANNGNHAFLQYQAVHTKFSSNPAGVTLPL